jgi:hypothetical protein
MKIILLTGLILLALLPIVLVSSQEQYYADHPEVTIHYMESNLRFNGYSNQTLDNFSSLPTLHSLM